MGKLNAKKLGLLPGDSLAKIKSQGAKFFGDRLNKYYQNELDPSTMYDYVLYDGTGNALYVKRRDHMSPSDVAGVSSMSDYDIIDGRVWFGKTELCSSDGKEFKIYTDEDGNNYNICIVDDLSRLNELRNTKMFNYMERSYNENNYKWLATEQYNTKNKPETVIPTDDGKWSSLDRLTTDDAIDFLYKAQQVKWIERKNKIAEDKYNAFEKSLHFIGTRIPCQSMQSFASMECVLFTDEEVNRIYIPAMIT